jgi:hypothetical protein
MVLSVLLIGVSSIVGISRAGKIVGAYESVGCSIAITLDDIINGNLSTSATYFVGLNVLASDMLKLNGNLSNVNTQLKQLSLSNTSSTLSQTYTAGTNLLNTLSQVPNGTAGQMMGNYTYSYFAASANSTFPVLLGAANKTLGSRKGAMNDSYTVIDGINENIIGGIGRNVDNFSLMSASLSGSLTSGVYSVNEILNSVVSLDGRLEEINRQISPYVKVISDVSIAFFSVFIGLGLVAIVGSVMMSCFYKFFCRYMIYVIMVIFFIFGLVCFVLAIVFSIVLPIIYFSCDWISVSISSSASFQHNLSPAFGSEIVNSLKVCLPGSSGDIINQLGVNMSNVNFMVSLVDEMRVYNATVLQS